MSNPIAEASPASLDALFSADPLGLTKEELGTICAELRRQREKWEQLEATGKSGGRKVSTKKAASPELTLDDLGI